MIAGLLSGITDLLQGKLLGTDKTFCGVSIDSRTLQADALFFSLAPMLSDAEKYAAAAFEKGAAAVVTARPLSIEGPQIILPDPALALRQLAQRYREQYHNTVIALTGSCGKTTTKMLMKNIFSRQASVCATAGNFNNALGLPLSILGADLQAAYWILEMGANHAGEIKTLTEIAQPQLALITNVGAAHLEGFKSLAGVAAAKAEIFLGLKKSGLAIINADDQFHAYWREVYSDCEFLTFGIESLADVFATEIKVEAGKNTSFVLNYRGEAQSVRFALSGTFNIYNALAAAAPACALGVPLAEIALALERVDPVPGRLRVCAGKNGAVLIDDTYNANPTAMEQALMYLSTFPKKRILIMGDMGELGSDAIHYHQAVGTQAKKYGVEAIYAVGEYTPHVLECFSGKGQHFRTSTDLIKQLTAILDNNTVFLIKGSRAAHMEDIVRQLALEKSALR